MLPILYLTRRSIVLPTLYLIICKSVVLPTLYLTPPETPSIQREMVWRRSDRARNIFNSNDRANLNAEIIGGGLTSEESSESEFVEGEKPWPPTEERESRARAQKQAPRVPRPHSHLFRLREGHSKGSKHSRRWENSMFLRTLHPISEEEFETASTILPSHHSPFSHLHSSDKHMQIWCSFSSRGEEDQEKLVPSPSSGSSGPLQERVAPCSGQDTLSTSSSYQDALSSTSSYQDTRSFFTPDGEGCLPQGVMSEQAPPTPEQRFRKVDSRIRAILQHNRHLPLGMMTGIEEELTHLLSASPQAVVLTVQTNPFYRLLVHGIAQYLGLKSATQHIGDGDSVLVIESRGRGTFTPSTTPLSAYLRTRSKPLNSLPPTNMNQKR